MSKNKSDNPFLSVLLPLLTAFLWGTGFIAQKANTAGAFTFNMMRCLLAVPVLLLAIFIFQKGKVKNILKEPTKEDTKTLWVGGILCGISLFFAMWLQQLGMDVGLDAGKAGFLTTLYTVFVPIFGFFLGRRTSASTLISIVIGMTGLYFLSIFGKSRSEIFIGDFYLIISAMCYAGQILLIDRFAPRTNCLKLSCIQLITVAVLSGISAFSFEEVRIMSLGENILPALYLAVFSNGVAYTMQMIAQKNGNPSLVSLLTSTESVFGALLSAWILKETMTGSEILGSFIMFVAVILSILLPLLGKRIRKKEQPRE